MHPKDVSARRRRNRGACSLSVDDLATFSRQKHRQPLPPHLQALRCQPRPLGDLAKDPQRGATAVRAGGITGKFLVGHVRIVLERAGRLHCVNPRPSRTPCEFCGDLGSEARTVDQSGEVHVVHHDLGTVVRPLAGREELTDAEIRDRAVKERTIIERFGHLESFWLCRWTREFAALPRACRKPPPAPYPESEGP